MELMQSEHTHILLLYIILTTRWTFTSWSDVASAWLGSSSTDNIHENENASITSAALISSLELLQLTSLSTRLKLLKHISACGSEPPLT